MNGSIEILLYLKNVMSDENYGNKEWDNSNSPIFVDQQIMKHSRQGESQQSIHVDKSPVAVASTIPPQPPGSKHIGVD